MLRDHFKGKGKVDERVLLTENTISIEEEDPEDMPKQLGKPVIISSFVDVDHTVTVVTRRPHSALIMACNKVRILINLAHMNLSSLQ